MNTNILTGLLCLLAGYAISCFMRVYWNELDKFLNANVSYVFIAGLILIMASLLINKFIVLNKK